MGEAGVGSHTSKLGTFLCPWQYVCQFTTKNLIRHDLWNVSKKITTFIVVKIATKTFKTFLSSCPMRIFAENWHTYCQEHKKKVPNSKVCDHIPAPPTTLQSQISEFPTYQKIENYYVVTWLFRIHYEWPLFRWWINPNFKNRDSHKIWQ